MPSLPTLMNAAQASHARGDFATAVKGYEAILARDPRNFDVAYLMAVALYQAGQLERAAKAFAAAAKLNPRRFEPHKDRGLVLMKLGRHAEAALSFESALKLSPRSPELLLNRGISLKNTGALDEAIACYRASLKLKPNFAEGYNNLANALGQLGQRDEALEAYAKARSLKPNYAEAYVNAAALLHETERFEEARALLEACLGHSPRHAGALRMLAQCLLMLGRDEEALATAGRAVAVDRGDVDSLLVRGEILDSLTREAEAMEDYSRALAREPRNVQALLAQARLLSRQSRFDEAVALCDRAIAAEPGNARAYYRIGRALEGRREFPAALLSYDKAIELDADWLAPRLRRAAVLADNGQPEQALAAYDALVETYPDSIEARAGRADVLRDLKRLEEALAAYDETIARAPDKAPLYGTRGALKTEMGREADALADYAMGLSILAGGDDGAQATARDCTLLLSVDKIPAIYESEEELALTRQRVEDVLDDLATRYEGHPPLGDVQKQVSEQAVRYLTGFYMAYHQRNDRPAMAKLSFAAGKLLSLANWEPPTRRASGRIRIGIASQRLRDHNGANWAYNWFAQLPRDDYDFFTYAFEPGKDELAVKFSELGTHRPLTWSRGAPHEVVRQMRDDRLDYLMLTDVGMTAVSRFLSLHRIAPRQFTAWGHPVTTGSPEMDFYLSSDLMEPPDAQDHYTEQLVRMPNLALFLEEKEKPEKAATPDRAAFGLPEGRLLYGCLQSLFKYVPRYDEILPMIASEVPEALFVFLEGSPSYMTDVMKQRLARTFAQHGLDSERHVCFLPRQKPKDFDRLMQAMDVCIDSAGWSGGNTTLRNIRFGVPLATLEGAFMRGRHSSAMFRMIGAEEMIARSVPDYVALLVRLGREKAFRQHCSSLFGECRGRLYRDHGFITAFDAFLKGNLAGA